MLLVGCNAFDSAKRQPNVVIFFTDDQGTLDVNCYGSTDLYTPNMDRLAAEGVRFTQAYAHTVCCPARAMLMTGRYPQRGGVSQWTQNNMKGEFGVNMALSEVTLAEALRDAGYKTALFGKWHLGAAETHGPTRQGFDTFFGHRGGFIDNYNHHFLHGRGFHDLYEATTEVFKRDQYFPDLMTARAIDYIDQNKDKPFFMYCAFNIPHYPEQSDPDLDALYQKLPMPRRSYAKMVTTTDRRIGLILDRLDELNLTDDTIIVFMSDNGHSEENNNGIAVDDHASGLPKGHYYLSYGGGGNTGKWRGAKGTFYEGGIRVPMMIRYPRKVGQGIVREQAVTAMDVMPTVLDWAGVKSTGPAFDGRSLDAVVNKDAPSPYSLLHWGWRDGWAIREGDWKLIKPSRGEMELVNLAEDEPERTNHADRRPGLVAHLSELQAKWLRDVTPQ